MLDVRVEKKNEDEYRKVYREVTGWLDRHENELIPQAALSSKKIVFDEVYFNRTYTQNIQLRNVGKTPIQYQIIDSRVFSPEKQNYANFKSDIGLSISPNKVNFCLKYTNYSRNRFFQKKCVSKRE